jgi:hypothetical protein
MGAWSDSPAATRILAALWEGTAWNASGACQLTLISLVFIIGNREFHLMDPSQKAQERVLEDAVSRALRDNLATLQRTADELHEACADLIAACSSSRPANSLPAMLRARTAAGALAARLEVLSNFITTALHPPDRPAAEVVVVESVAAHQPATPEVPAPSIPTPMAAVETVEPQPAEHILEVPPPAETAPPSAWDEVAADVAEPALRIEDLIAEERPIFDVSRLPVEEQELHRRANRIAKVAMQDIQLLRPEDVRLGREHRDLCARLRGDLDKARKEYDRRFRTILDHPVDYFHHWMVEILAAGDAEALGEYPYPSPVLRR